MLLRQLREGRAEVENQYTRVVPWEGNRAALGAMADVFELRPYFEWRGLGFISQSALRLSDRYAAWDAERRFAVPGVQVTDPKAAQCGEVLKGVLQASALQAVRQGMHARASGRRADGVVGRIVRGVLHLRASQGRRARPDGCQLARRPRDRAASPTVTFRDPRIEMAHGAGGKASRRLIEGLIAPLLMGASAEPLGDAAHRRRRRRAARGHLRQLRRHAAAVSRRLDRRARGQRHGERSGGVGRAAESPCWSRSCSKPGCRRRCSKPRCARWRDAARARGRADRRRRHQGRRARQGRRDVRHHRRASASLLPGVSLAAPAVRPGDRVLVSGPIGDHGITILLARGDLDLEADLSSDTRSVLPLVDALVDAAGPGVRWMRDPTRGGVATALNELARDCGLGIALAEERVPVRDGVRGACELLGLDPLHIANEGQFLAIVAPELRRRGAGGAQRRARWRSLPRDIGEIREQPARHGDRRQPATAAAGSSTCSSATPLPRIC